MRELEAIFGLVIACFVIALLAAIALTLAPSCKVGDPIMTLQSIQEVQRYQWAVDTCADEARDAGHASAFDVCIERKGLRR